MPKSITSKGSKGSGLASLGAASQVVQQAPIASAIQGAQAAQTPPAPTTPTVQGAEMAQAQTAAPMSGMAQATPPAPTWIGQGSAAKPAGIQQQTKEIKSSQSPAGKAEASKPSEQPQQDAGLNKISKKLLNFKGNMQNFWKGVNAGENPGAMIDYIKKHDPVMADMVTQNYMAVMSLNSYPKEVPIDDFYKLVDRYGSGYIKNAGIRPDTVSPSFMPQLSDIMGAEWLDGILAEKEAKGAATLQGTKEQLIKMTMKLGNITGNAMGGFIDGVGNLVKLTDKINPLAYLENATADSSGVFGKGINLFADILSPGDYVAKGANEFNELVDSGFGDNPKAQFLGEMSVALVGGYAAGAKATSYVDKISKIILGTELGSTVGTGVGVGAKLLKGAGAVSKFATVSIAETAGAVAAMEGRLPSTQDMLFGLAFDGVLKGGGKFLEAVIAPTLWRNAVNPKAPTSKIIESNTSQGIKAGIFGTKKQILDAVEASIKNSSEKMQSLLKSFDDSGIKVDVADIAINKELLEDIKYLSPYNANAEEAYLKFMDNWMNKVTANYGKFITPSQMLSLKQDAAEFLQSAFAKGTTGDLSLTVGKQATVLLWKQLDDQLSQLSPEIKQLNSEMTLAYSIKNPVESALTKAPKFGIQLGNLTGSVPGFSWPMTFLGVVADRMGSTAQKLSVPAKVVTQDQGWADQAALNAGIAQPGDFTQGMPGTGQNLNTDARFQMPGETNPLR